MVKTSVIWMVIAFAVTVVGHRTYAYACIVRVNQTLPVRYFIFGDSRFQYSGIQSGIPAFSKTPQCQWSSVCIFVL